MEVGVGLWRAGSFLECPSCGSISMATTTLMFPDSRVTVRVRWDEGTALGFVLMPVACFLDGGSAGVAKDLFLEDWRVSTSGRFSNSQ